MMNSSDHNDSDDYLSFSCPDNTNNTIFNDIFSIGDIDNHKNNKTVINLNDIKSIPPWLQNQSNQDNIVQKKYHANNNQKKNEAYNVIPALISLHNEIIDLCNYLTPNTDEKCQRDLVIEDLRKISSSIWPTSVLHVFGSTMTNLLTPNSDLDIAILNVPMNDTGNVISLLDELSRMIRLSLLASYVEVISNAKFPIIKLDHIKGRLSVDICINNSNGLNTGKLIKKYIRLYPPLRPLMLVIKLFLSQRKMHETYSGGIGSFVLCNMIISFIQQRQRLAAHLNTSFSWNLGCLLLDFFKLYGFEFNYVVTGLSIVNNGFYFNKQERGSEWFNPNKPITLSVENPDPTVTPSVDIGKNSYMLSKVKRVFEHAYNVLNSVIVNGKYNNNTNGNNSGDRENTVSYLSYIIRADDKAFIGRECGQPTSSGLNNIDNEEFSDDDSIHLPTRTARNPSLKQSSTEAIHANRYHTSRRDASSSSNSSTVASTVQQAKQYLKAMPNSLPSSNIRIIYSDKDIHGNGGKRGVINDNATKQSKKTQSNYSSSWNSAHSNNDSESNHRDGKNNYLVTKIMAGKKIKRSERFEDVNDQRYSDSNNYSNDLEESTKRKVKYH